jgi:hypothetical protein
MRLRLLVIRRIDAFTVKGNSKASTTGGSAFNAQ